jgi:ribonuclease HI
LGLIIHVDGGSRGNPGPAAAGVVIHAADGTRIHEAGYFLGEQTNNAAEYLALIRALQRAERCGNQPVSIISDSELLVRQLTGQYRVKSPSLAKLFQQVQLLLLRVSLWKVQHVRRELNARADELANLAMDRQADVIEYDIDQPAAPPAREPPGRSGAPRAARRSPDSGQPGGAPPRTDARAAPEVRPVRVVQVRPAGRVCPAHPASRSSFVVRGALPAGLCLHAAHALVSTVLAVQNTDAAEFAAIPTLTVRCTRAECGATFHVTPEHSGNGGGDGSASAKAD